MIRNIICLLIACAVAVIMQAQVSWPQITATSKPWTRWWWEGSAVNEEELTWNLEQYKQAGIGGTEITPIYGIHGQEQKFVDFLSPRWMELFSFTLKESKRLGLGVDLANGTGWPFGGPWVKDADASKSIYYKTYALNGNQQLKEPVLYMQEGFVRTANNKPAIVAAIKNPLPDNKNLQALALDQVQFPGRLPLKTLMAYPDKGAPVDLTAKVEASGKLNWTAPPGAKNWTLYALFEGLHGKMVERAAPGGEGYAIDHFSKQAAANYFKRFDQAFKASDISYLRSFFNDSYEVDDARGQANWTPEFFAEFKKRKGYDLRNELPALFGEDEADKNSRVRYDYRSVIDELLLEHFTMEWKKWSDGKGKMLRNQSHGSPANTLDLYGVVDIPETEGNDILRFKFASSAAHVTGKQLVSSESATWLNEHFLSSWGDVKKAIDLYFLGGINHVFYHGTAYSPREAPWPGWLFYAAVHFQPVNPQWKDFHALNTYIARIQSFLQMGKPDNDLLLYYPIIDRYSAPGNALLQHFDGMEKNFEHTGFEQVSNAMVEKGYGFDFFSDRQLQQFRVASGHIVTGGNQYTAIMLPANHFITDESFGKILALARAGATVLVYKKLPSDVPGLYQLDARRSKLSGLIRQLRFTQQGNAQKAVIGKGSVWVGEDLETLMQAGAIRKEKPADKEIYILRQKNMDGRIYFINNRTERVAEEWLPLTADAASVALFDAMSGEKGLANWRKKENGIEVRVQLQPHASMLVQTFDTKRDGDPFPYKNSAGAAIPVKGNWNLSFLEGGPVLPASQVISTLGSWTDAPGDAVKNFSGTAKYTIAFDRPGNAEQYLLNLGTVHETAEVILNGKSLATLIGPSFTAVIPASALQKTNRLEIVVANRMANRIAYMDREQLPWKIFYNVNMPARLKENGKNGLFNAAHWKPLPSGLLGPVTLTPLQ
ncbi:glycoside hydrolase family 2 protein [Niabella sp. CC-SYL272]|uniref:glycosyl hydrolase n=1 Tax=Niabella agricola TaxID=2891571 RepID=UPI001F3B9011|nr:glycosyl hydrolase [Niabella agricola]MCF3108156.1 glycoside hydrolase family 2 protein [Niabella agricola]